MSSKNMENLKNIKIWEKHYNRNVMYLSKYISPDQVPGDVQIVLDPEVTVGSFVTVIDVSGDERYHIAEVIDIPDENVMVHYLYYETKSRQIRGAKWVSLYHHPGTNQVVQHELQTYVRNWTRLTGDIKTDPEDDSLIILATP